MINQLKYYIILLLCIVITLQSNGQSVHYPDSSVLSSGVWYSVSISSDGIYKLTYNDFITLGVAPQDINFDDISIFGNTGKAISEINADYKISDLQENAIYVNKQERYVLFYAQATTKRIYNNNDGKFSFELHPYDNTTKYFITFDKSIGQKKRITAIENQPDTYTKQTNIAKDYTFHKRELYNLLEAGRDWVGEKFLPNASNQQIPISLPNVNTDYKAIFDISLVANSNFFTSFDILLNNNKIGNTSIGKVSGSSEARKELFVDSSEVNLTSNTLSLHFNSSSPNDQGWLNYIVVNYTKNLNFNNNYLRFFATSENWQDTIQYNINNVYQNNCMIWDVTNPTDVKQITYATYNQPSLSFNIVVDTLKTIVVLNGSNFASPVLEDTVDNQNLHGIDTAEFLIITHKDFINQAERLADIHRKYDKISVSVVELQQVFNEFSSGTKDFLAMREFIRMIYNKSNGKYPKNVLLFGDGTFDNKNILQYNNNFIPTYQAISNNFSTSEAFTSDDVLSSIGDKATNHSKDSLYVGIGRLPINDTVTAEIVVDKCERYISKSDLRNKENGDWRNSIMLTSDDCDNTSELYFIKYAENIYNQINETYPTINIHKVYQDAYKEYTSSAGATYPDASNAVNYRMKQGCLLFNYLGHGSPKQLSSESLITISDIASWNNYNKLCLMITSTCEFNRFDLADRQSAGEYMLTSELGAGIALISAARKIASDDYINKYLHRFALEKQADGKSYTFGQILQHTKNNVNYLSSTDRSISLIGDPALRISLPDYNIRTLQINNSIYNQATQSLSSIDTIEALSTVFVRGEIIDEQGNRIDNFNGKIQVSLYDKKSIYYTLNNSNVVGGKLAFEQQNNILHKGEAVVENGVFVHSFVVPKDIAYNYGIGKLSYYAQNDSMDASGYCTEFIIGGIDTTMSLIEESRPIINLYLNDTNFVSGGISDENPSLYAVVYDTIPINIVGSGLGHDIVARLDNAANTFILNDYYIKDEQDANKGYITFPFKNLSAGQHTLTLKVWNIYNYSSEKTITFTVETSDENVYQAVNYPNPFKDYTTIELRYNKPENITSAYIKIFNQQGAVVDEFDISDKIGTYNIGPIQWNGTTNGGATIQNGLYYYIIVLKTKDKDKIIKGNKMIFMK